MTDYCCVDKNTLPAWELCRCGSWDVKMIWAHMIGDAHHCRRCIRARTVSEDMEFDAGRLKWAHLPPIDASSQRPPNTEKLTMEN